MHWKTGIEVPNIKNPVARSKNSSVLTDTAVPSVEALGSNLGLVTEEPWEMKTDSSEKMAPKSSLGKVPIWWARLRLTMTRKPGSNFSSEFDRVLNVIPPTSVRAGLSLIASQQRACSPGGGTVATICDNRRNMND